MAKYCRMELRLKEILTERGITLKDFSMASGISQSNLSNYHNGNISPTLETLKRIAASLGVELAELFKAKDDIEFYVRHDGEYYPIRKQDILDMISKKKRL